MPPKLGIVLESGTNADGIAVFLEQFKNVSSTPVGARSGSGVKLRVVA